ncbi:Serine/threonine-protein kinase pkn3 [Minicystis rosea]|nr:Serine/threonine-protein kinase pkn3 [Minicystis rosea]
MAKLNQQADGEIAPGTIVDGRYRVIRSIGQGGNGLVYEVEHTRTGRRLALKALLDETGFARLEQEARAASLMKNGHTARIIDMEPGSTSGPYMVMELLEGQSLRDLLDEAGQLPLELTVNIAMQVCECLQEAHGLSIIHRDLKPENVFLCPSPWPGQYDVKVLDFGVMKVADGGGAIPKSSLTRTGSTVGTPYYMSLEQLRNSSAVDARADVYSLGVVLYECLSGRKPFQADTIGDLVYALCSGPPTPLSRLRPDLPAEVSDVVMRTLSANRDDRPTTMVDLAAALLPHANAAFALWVKVDGRQPALAPRAPMSSLAEVPAPRPLAVPRPAAGVASPPRAVLGPSSMTPLLAVAPTVASPPPLDEADKPATNQAWPPPDRPEGRRDTPTEMYVKGVHGIPSPPERDSAGDRDTPTRAYEVPLSVSRAPMVETLKSASPLDDEHEPGTSTARMDDPAGLMGPRFGAPPPAAAPPAAPPSSNELGVPAAALMTMPLPKGSVPLGNIMRSLPSAPNAPPPSAPASPKPAWQVSLDRALVRVGRTGEGLVKRYRAAPQNTQIIVLIVAATVALLLLGTIVFMIVH